MKLNDMKFKKCHEKEAVLEVVADLMQNPSKSSTFLCSFKNEKKKLLKLFQVPSAFLFAVCRLIYSAVSTTNKITIIVAVD